MPLYQFESIDDNGITKRGQINADSLEQLKQLLKQQQQILLEAKPINQQNFGTVPSQQVVDMTRHLASLLDAGLPLADCLAAITQEQNNQLSPYLKQIRQAILEGKTFAFALGQYPKIFSTLYIALVQAGEESGYLSLILNQFANYLDSQAQLKAKIQQAFLYPVIVLGLSMLMMLFLMTYVLPQVTQVFKSKGQNLPAITTFFMEISRILREDYLWLIAGLAILILLAYILLRIPSINYILHKMVLRLPMVAKLVLGYDTVRFTSTLSILYNAGVPILRSIQAAIQTMHNLIIKQQVQQASKEVEQGSSLFNALKKTPFKPSVLYLIQSGEQTGKLASMLSKASEDQQKQLERYTIGLTSLLEPILVVLMGLMVMSVVLAVLLPIMDLNLAIKTV